MSHDEQTDPEPPPRKQGGGEVVRLTLGDEGGLAKRLGPMPSEGAGTRTRLPRTEVPSLIEDELEEDLGEPLLDPGTEWDREELPERTTPVGWLALIGVLLAGLGIWSLTKMARGEANIDDAAGKVEERLAAGEAVERDAIELVTRLETALRRYLAATSVESKAEQVRHPERVLPLMRHYYAGRKLQPAVFNSIQDLRNVTISHRPFLYVRARMDGDVSRPFVIEQSEDGVLRFDWESEVIYQPTSLEEFQAARSGEASNFRVYAKEDSFYAFEFADSERFRCLYVTIPMSDEFFFGYTERGSEVDRQVVRQLEQAPGRALPFVLRLRFLPDSRAPRSVTVEEMVAPRWTFAESPGAAGD